MAGRIRRKGREEKRGSRRKKPRGSPRVASRASLEARTVRPGFPIVGVGASAGGLDAFRKLLAAMPVDSGMAFVLIPHLSPTQKSLMAELLSTCTAMPVEQVKARTRVEANHVYVIPPSKDLAVRGGVLYLKDQVPRSGTDVPIDYFLRSLAEDQREKAICIILSGTGTSGTLGVRAVKACGGLAIVQDPETAEYQGMPQSAVATGLVDHVLPVERMPGVLSRYRKQPYLAAPIPSEEEIDRSASDVEAIIALLRTRARLDFSGYRKSTLLRRIRRRMGVNYIERLPDYVRLLRDDASEIGRLRKDLMIGVTSFFREPVAFEELRAQAVSRLVKDSSPDEPLRVWVPGCATGEEAYSIAMVLIEEMSATYRSRSLQVFATDIDEEALEFARVGRYPVSISLDVTPERIRRFFSIDDHCFRISKDVREVVTFAAQNLISDPPFSRLHLVSCRNVLIYLEPQIQSKALALFHFALNPEGFLFLGSSESLCQAEGLFGVVSKKWRIFRRLGVVRPPALDLAVAAARRKGPDSSGSSLKAAQRIRLQDLSRDLLLEHFGGAGLLVNSKGVVLHFHGSTGKYLNLPRGQPTMDLLSLAREGLRVKLQVALQEAARKKESVSLEGVRVKRDGEYACVRVTVAPVKEPLEADGLLLVIFQDEPRPRTRVPRAKSPGPREEQESAIRQLEYDLKVTREELQGTIEELSASNEELKAANEEILSMNEELQASKEELQTSKEELQSVNEELSTVNGQLQEKVEELSVANSDLSNLLSSTDIATLFLDPELRIKRFTPAAGTLLSLIPTDVGRPVSHFSQNLLGVDLLDDVGTVLRDVTSVQKEVRDRRGNWHLMRITPYRAGDVTSGAVLTFTEVSHLKRLEERLTALNRRLEDRVKEKSAALSLLHEITRPSGEAESPAEAFRLALRKICGDSHFQVGVAYVRDDDHPDEVVPSESSYAAAGTDYRRFLQSSKRQRVTKGEGLVGRAFASGEVSWYKSSSEEPASTLARMAHKTGLEGAVAVPVVLAGETLAVLAFFSRAPIDLEEETQRLMADVGTQLGWVLERKRLQAAFSEAVWAERQRIVQELHDGLGQELTALGLMSKTLSQVLEGKGLGEWESSRKISEGIQRAVEEVRNLSRGLFPAEVGPDWLVAALRQLAETTRSTAGISCSFRCPSPVLVGDAKVAMHLHRIAQEAVTNAIKHARCRHVEIGLTKENALTKLEVRDDGAGIEAGPSHLGGAGLSIMRYRAALIGGKLEVCALERGGTLVSCVLGADVAGAAPRRPKKAEGRRSTT